MKPLHLYICTALLLVGMCCAVAIVVAWPTPGADWVTGKLREIEPIGQKQ